MMMIEKIPEMEKYDTDRKTNFVSFTLITKEGKEDSGTVSFLK